MSSEEELKRLWEEKLKNYPTPGPSQGKVPYPVPDPTQGKVYGGARAGGANIVTKSPYRDKDDFDRDVGADTELVLSPHLGSFDEYLVTRPADGTQWKMTGAEVVNRGMGSTPFNRPFIYQGSPNQTLPSPVLDAVGNWYEPPNNGDAEVKTHILYQGETLCRELKGRPVDWPKGHEWVSLEHARTVPEGYSSGVTCVPCIDEMFKRKLK